MKMHLVYLYVLASLLSFVLADYECLCNYHVEAIVHQTDSDQGTKIGSMAEFDCKPTYAQTASVTNWQAVQFEKQVGYVALDAQTKVQTCQGLASPTDLVQATTTMKTTVVSSQAPVSIQVSTAMDTTVSSSSTTSSSSPTTTTTDALTTTPTAFSTTTTKASSSTPSSTVSTRTTPLSTSPSSTFTSPMNTFRASSPTTRLTAPPTTTTDKPITSTAKATTTTQITTTTTEAHPTTTSMKTTPPSSTEIFTTMRSTPTTRKTTSTSTKHTTEHTTVKVLQCPPLVPKTINMKQFNGHCYEFVTGVHKEWPDAERDCKRKGGHLVSIRSKPEQDFVYRSLIQLHFHGDNGVWIGFTDQNHEGRWTWASGETKSFTYWASGQPGIGASFEDCALMEMGKGGHWGDYSCTGILFTHERHGYVCEYNMI